MARSSLIPFHRVLISAGILFCAGFALWSWLAASPTLAVVFAILAAALGIYLWNLNRILGYPSDRRD